jgi:adenylate kinase family enzyme
MRIHIFGASGAGSTTLGKALSAIMDIPYYDTDSYFWEASNPPFTVKRAPAERNRLLKAVLEGRHGYIIGGSLVGWDESWTSIFDLAIFLYLPHDIRMERLKQREWERYGDVIHSDPERIRLYQEFMDWAASYDTGTERRSLKVHKTWMEKLSCPVLSLEGDIPLAERIKLVRERISRFCQ